jgi:dCTP deaminase
MIVNGPSLLIESPIHNMLTEKHRAHGVSHGLAEVGYDLRLKQTVEFHPSPVGPGYAIVKCEGLPDAFSEGNFALASAIEEFNMPDGLAGIVHDKSSWARKGLSVFNTVIEPGWRGFLTLELVYHGRGPLVIPAGSGIAQVIFHRVAHLAIYEGKYQDQADRPVETIDA